MPKLEDDEDYPDLDVSEEGIAKETLSYLAAKQIAPIKENHESLASRGSSKVAGHQVQLSILSLGSNGDKTKTIAAPIQPLSSSPLKMTSDRQPRKLGDHY